MKKILALALIASLCLSACSGTGGESSPSNSSTSTSEGTTSSSSAVEQSSSSSSDANASTSTTTEGALTLEEIKTIFSELDAKRNELMKWFYRDYTKIPIDNVPTRKLENVVIYQIMDGNDVKPVYGDVVFAKVTEKTLPGFPWSSVEEIKNDILKIYDSISDASNFTYIVGENFDNLKSIFYQFDDGLYFRVHDKGSARDIYWDYSTIEILENKPDVIDVFMREVGHGELLAQRRILSKNKDGDWVIEFE